ncbi:MAG: hypothetical protein FJ211_09525 [Ignavibacteria bacterium]|nr:hypothetical protein [Ignavibacteria bacterium]
MSKQEVSLEAMEKIVEELPFGNYINVAKHVTYDVLRIVEHLIEEGIVVDEESIMERVEGYAKDDFSCGWGHEVRLKDLVFTDEHGEEII